MTVLANLSMVAVYSVHYMVVSSIQNLTTSFVSGMEALFGDMLAKKERNLLDKSFGHYEAMISAVSIILLGTTLVMITPFICIYTAQVSDTDYNAPAFAALLTLTSIVYCFRMPYHSAIIAAGHFRQTQFAAYGEAIINIGLSIVLVKPFGLSGVAIATFLATVFRFVYYAVYLTKNILNRSIGLFIKREIVNALCLLGVVFLGKLILRCFDIKDYIIWAVCGILVVLMAVILVIVFYMIFYRDEIGAILRKMRPLNLKNVKK